MVEDAGGVVLRGGVPGEERFGDVEYALVGCCCGGIVVIAVVVVVGEGDGELPSVAFAPEGVVGWWVVVVCELGFGFALSTYLTSGCFGIRPGAFATGLEGSTYL